MSGLSNWTNYKFPFQRLDVFTRHEPFPSEELKATYIDSDRRKPQKKDRSLLALALERRWSDGTRR